MADLLNGVRPEMPPTPAEPSPEISGFEADERAFEQSSESRQPFVEQPQEGPTTKIETEAVQTAAAPRTNAPPARIVDETTIAVEKILEEDLGELYMSLSPAAKPVFKKKGEEVSTEIAAMVRSLKIQVSRAIRLIRDWLLTIPNANKFFLEQEAKLKTDELVQLVEERKEEMSQTT